METFVGILRLDRLFNSRIGEFLFKNVYISGMDDLIFKSAYGLKKKLYLWSGLTKKTLRPLI